MHMVVIPPGAAEGPQLHPGYETSVYVEGRRTAWKSEVACRLFHPADDIPSKECIGATVVRLSAASPIGLQHA